MVKTIIKSYTAQYINPITLFPRDEVTLGQEETEEKWKGWIWATHGGQAGWIPLQIIANRVENKARITAAYTARELSVSVGDQVAVSHTLNGWLWADFGAVSGWIPAECVEETETK